MVGRADGVRQQINEDEAEALLSLGDYFQWPDSSSSSQRPDSSSRRGHGRTRAAARGHDRGGARARLWQARTSRAKVWLWDLQVVLAMPSGLHRSACFKPLLLYGPSLHLLDRF
jgi:hypothetical protein